MCGVEELLLSALIGLGAVDIVIAVVLFLANPYEMKPYP